MPAPSRRLTTLFLVLAALTAAPVVQAQDAAPMDRIPFGGQDLWLNGGNVAWVEFARDIGPGTTNLAAFEAMFEEVRAAGGNSMRLWLHTNGGTTPAWDGDRVVGPGEGTVEDLRAILDAAWRHEVGLVLCLWSFDMLRTSYGPAVTDRNYALLTDLNRTREYVTHGLVPLVEGVRGHPGILAWEVFNEPEGMSDEFGWNFTRHVPMQDIQRFINRTAGAIHRADPGALVTNGSWSFHAMTDRATKRGAAALAPPAAPARRAAARAALAERYDHPFTDADVDALYARLGGAATNYYRDDRLVAAGGDPDGTLDFYSVHYYEWGGTALSPFHHPVGYWGLDKPLVVAEFYLYDTRDGDGDAIYGVPYGEAYERLFDGGYAGAMGWQWYDAWRDRQPERINWPRILENMATMAARHPEAVAVRPRLFVAYFRADPPGVERGGASTLAWSVAGAAGVTLDGEAVEPVGTRTVAPDTTTTYTLVAVGADAAERDTVRLTVEVLAPLAVNRARTRPVEASSTEAGLTSDDPAFVVDGDPGTRWSSEWQDGRADADPDDEWLAVDLGRAFDLDRVVIDWEAAYALDYDLEASYDGYTWTTIHAVRGGDGGTDEVTFADAPAARYVRLHGLRRATRFGYSIWEMEVYGLPSERQPPAVSVVGPATGALVAPGAAVTLRAEADDPDGSVRRVTFLIDGKEMAVDETAPYEYAWDTVPAGAHAVAAVAVDDDGIAVRSDARPLYAAALDAFTTYEAEDAAYVGDVARAPAASASGGAFLDFRDAGTITFDVRVDAPGDYLLAFRYNLFYDVPKSQYLVVNGDTVETMVFDGPRGTWTDRGVRVALRGGANTVALHKFWGWMYVDALRVQGTPLNVAAEDAPTGEGLALGAAYPNPVGAGAEIPYTLPDAAHVRLDVYDVVGRRVATLVDGVRGPGTHRVRLEAAGLASGVYLVRLRAGDGVRTTTLTVTK